jgi:hypothetical protein
VNAGLGELPPDQLPPGRAPALSARPSRVPIIWRRVARLMMSLVLGEIPMVGSGESLNVTVSGSGSG